MRKYFLSLSIVKIFTFISVFIQLKTLKSPTLYNSYILPLINYLSASTKKPTATNYPCGENNSIFIGYDISNVLSRTSFDKEIDFIIDRVFGHRWTHFDTLTTLRYAKEVYSMSYSETDDLDTVRDMFLLYGQVGALIFRVVDQKFKIPGVWGIFITKKFQDFANFL
jgi:hypothetical protein